MAPPKRTQNPSGLGRAIINRKIKDHQRAESSPLYSVDLDSTRLKSITQERDLDEFFTTAQLAGTDFTAERRNVKVINQTAPTSQNPYLLSAAEEAKVLKKQEENESRLRVPRRPAWKRSMKHEELDLREKAAFLEWRRSLAQLQEGDDFLLTPFERNIEVWRQLWRVIERSHLVVQIVDARNPLRFRCKDLEDYVEDVEGSEGEAGSGPGKRTNMLLINKADLLTAHQRHYFDKEGIKYAFYSAALGIAIQEARKEAADALEREAEAAEAAKGSDSEDEDEEDEGTEQDELKQAEADAKEQEIRNIHISADDDDEDVSDPRIRILSVVELEELFHQTAPPLTDFHDASGKPPTKLSIGLVGYPNVGKSSTINSLIGEKKVSVSSTPGKTKHFQTINLSDDITLCDCPGLVFPQFATTKADLVCDGVMPIDQLREYIGPVGLVVKRLPRSLLEATYGLAIKVREAEDGGDGKVRPDDFLQTYATARGFTRAGQGNPDEARAARWILKDYVNGKLLYCHPPPTVTEAEFNEETHRRQLLRVSGKKKAPLTRVSKDSDVYVTPIPVNPDGTQSVFGHKSVAVDDDFFERHNLAPRPFVAGSNKNAMEFSRSTFYPNQVLVGNDGKPLSGQQMRLQAILQNVDVGSSKKNHKKPKRAKQRSGKGYD
ncbi:hypothetical protein D9611_005746 [Ephemerocybe angulata]|uniref:CP-type G domain-containing protein n=1 Tax=Ephemerocybe angulata TaxID=980116 RepID=A0A8H5F4G3_9AGAR|nr:hypothetical protein D9611_005746 [Tulosesus angulatus]